MFGLLRQLRRAIAQARRPDLVIAVLAGAFAWFITRLLRAAIGSD
jgi:hypothetical protein